MSWASMPTPATGPGTPLSIVRGATPLLFGTEAQPNARIANVQNANAWRISIRLSGTDLFIVVVLQSGNGSCCSPLQHSVVATVSISRVQAGVAHVLSRARTEVGHGTLLVGH